MTSPLITHHVKRARPMPAAHRPQRRYPLYLRIMIALWLLAAWGAALDLGFELVRVWP